MLTEQRYETILRMLEERGSVTVTELKDLLDASESTVRRDITALGKAGRLIKVFGGAVAMEHIMTGSEPTVAQKVEVNKEEKCRIASYAARLIEPEDFIFLDAGTTTGYMMDYLEENREIVTALIKVNAPDGFGKKMIGVIEECRMELLPYRSVEDAYAARFLATGVIGMTEKWITESQPIPKTEMVSLITKLLTPLTPLVPQSEAAQN